MNLHDALYIYEHKVLPTNFFNFKGDFVATILKRKEVLYKVFDGMLAEEGISNPYTEENFRVDVLRSDAELMVLKITFPEPVWGRAEISMLMDSRRRAFKSWSI